MTTNDVLAELTQAFPDTPRRLRELRDKLAIDAQASGVLDVAYRTVESPVGTLLLAATELGLVRVAFSNEDHDAVLQSLSVKVSPRILGAPATGEVLVQLAHRGVQPRPVELVRPGRGGGLDTDPR